MYVAQAMIDPSHSLVLIFMSPIMNCTPHKHTHTYAYTYICICIRICVCVCVCVYIERERERRNLFFSEPDLDRSPFSSAYLSGRKRESDANNFLGAVSKLFILCAKCVNWNLSFSGTSATLQT